MIQVEEVTKIQQRWVEDGSPLCSHERTDREFYGNWRTGDVACLSCGDRWAGKNLFLPPAVS
jgi:hypothetical protein